MTRTLPPVAQDAKLRMKPLHDKSTHSIERKNFSPTVKCSRIIELYVLKSQEFAS